MRLPRRSALVDEGKTPPGRQDDRLQEIGVRILVERSSDRFDRLADCDIGGIEAETHEQCGRGALDEVDRPRRAVVLRDPKHQRHVRIAHRQCRDDAVEMDVLVHVIDRDGMVRRRRQRCRCRDGD
jgi:hypothetical protein